MIYAVQYNEKEYPDQIKKVTPFIEPRIHDLISSCGSDGARQSRLVSFMLSACAVSWYSHGSRSGDDIIRTDNGKPVIRDGYFHFSLAHSGNAVVCALGNDNLGIDIERVRRFKGRVALRYFSELERRMTRLPFLGHWFFFKVWTRKESFVKMTGEGVSGLEAAPDFTICPRERKQARETISFMDVRTFPGYVCSLCVMGSKTTVKVKKIESDDIVEEYIKLRLG